MKDDRRAFLHTRKQVLERLDDVLERSPSDRIVIDAAIQRFEFCFELGWKTLKVFLEFEGQEAPTPRQTLKAGFRLQWIADEPGWHQMLEDRNQTSHTYHEALADEIYSRLPEHYARMSRLCSRLEQQVASS